MVHGQASIREYDLLASDITKTIVKDYKKQLVISYIETTTNHLFAIIDPIGTHNIYFRFQKTIFKSFSHYNIKYKHIVNILSPYTQQDI